MNLTIYLKLYKSDYPLHIPHASINYNSIFCLLLSSIPDLFIHLNICKPHFHKSTCQCTSYKNYNNETINKSIHKYWPVISKGYLNNIIFSKDRDDSSGWELHGTPYWQGFPQPANTQSLQRPTKPQGHGETQCIKGFQ